MRNNPYQAPVGPPRSTRDIHTYNEAHDEILSAGFRPVPGSSRYENDFGQVARIVPMPGSGDTFYIDVEVKQNPMGFDEPKQQWVFPTREEAVAFKNALKKNRGIRLSGSISVRKTLPRPSGYRGGVLLEKSSDTSVFFKALGLMDTSEAAKLARSMGGRKWSTYVDGGQRNPREAVEYPVSNPAGYADPHKINWDSVLTDKWHASIEVIDTLNDHKVQDVRFRKENFEVYLDKYKAPRYVVQVLDFKRPRGREIVVDNQGIDGGIRVMNPAGYPRRGYPVSNPARASTGRSNPRDTYYSAENIPWEDILIDKDYAGIEVIEIANNTKIMSGGRFSPGRFADLTDRYSYPEYVVQTLDYKIEGPNDIVVDNQGPNGVFRILHRARNLDGSARQNPAQEREIFNAITKRRNPDVFTALWSEAGFGLGAAKAVWAQAFMNAMDMLRDEDPELARELDAGSGADVMDVLPDLPPAAYKDAQAFEEAVLEANNLSYISELIARAAEADGVDPEDIDEEEFGHYVMMSALGHGVSWFDDHGDFLLKLPRWEPSVEMDNAMHEWIEKQ